MSLRTIIGQIFSRPVNEIHDYVSTNGFTVNIESQKITVPYRVNFSSKYVAADSAEHYCRRSRSSDGHKREAALRKLITYKQLTPQESAYLLVALGDYVLEISAIPLDASNEVKDELRKLVKNNRNVVKYLDAVTISYWNEYYRRRYASYADYPPYKFLQDLKEQ